MTVSPPPQVSFRTVLTVCLGVLTVGCLAYAVTQARIAITLTLLASMIAITMHHGEAYLVRNGLRRWMAIGVVGIGMIVTASIFAIVLIPPAVSQAQVMASELPQLLEKVRHNQLFQLLDQRLGLGTSIDRVGREAPAVIFQVVNAAVGLVAATVSMILIAVFMLIFGDRLIGRMLADLGLTKQQQIGRVLDNFYHAIGGYVFGVTVIAVINSVFMASFLAILRMPFFLPLALLSGMLSLLPYVGSFVTSVLIVILALVTLGTWPALAAAVYCIVFGQIEGNVVGPMIFRRTVHVNPLVTTLSILFLGEMFGIVGAFMAIPVVVTIQIILREVLRSSRERRVRARLPSGTPVVAIRGILTSITLHEQTVAVVVTTAAGEQVSLTTARAEAIETKIAPLWGAAVVAAAQPDDGIYLLLNLHRAPETIRRPPERDQVDVADAEEGPPGNLPEGH